MLWNTVQLASVDQFRDNMDNGKTVIEGDLQQLLDEPANDLGVETLHALENALLGFPGCAILISNDR
ncbi:MAG: Energy-dependent translational throttle protein EttA [Sodalis sp.]|nr:MAG: Energy-dependent translational throttle protein EttA [Sodalis sp.]